MLSEEGRSKFDLPEELLEVLPSDPFQQLDVAWKITSIALSTRVNALQSEASALRQQLADRDAIISGLESQLKSLGEAKDRLAAAQQEKESLMRENVELSITVKKLNGDVAKLEAFRKTLMRSLQEDNDNPASHPPVAAPQLPSSLDDDPMLPPTRTTSMHSQFSDAGNSHAEEIETQVRPRTSQGVLLASQTSTPRLTPLSSPPTLSASVSPPRTPRPVSPRRHPVSFPSPSSQFDSMPSWDSGSQSAGKTRLDGKEFFRQVRNRLSYEQFGAFLANVKELNSQTQTKEETLKKVDEIFGQDNKDLYAIFEGLIARNVQS